MQFSTPEKGVMNGPKSPRQVMTTNAKILGAISELVWIGWTGWLARGVGSGNKKVRGVL